MDRAEVEEWCRLDVQQYLWFKLPSRSDEDLHEAAWALGDLLESIGRPGHAAVCRDRHTHEILAAWRRDRDRALEMGMEAMRASGLLPPDTPSLTFGEVMGREELGVFYDLAVELERAIDAGQLDPSAPGFGRAQARLTEAFLDKGGLWVVRRERARSWAMGLRGDVGWLDLTLPRLEEHWAVPDNVELSLAPARALLELASEKITLTGSGYLPPTLVLQLNDRFRWYDFMGRPPSKQKDVPALTFIREHLTRLHLLQSRKGILSTTAKGRAALADDGVFWDAVTSTRRWDDFTQEVVAVSAALLLSNDDLERGDLSREVARKIEHRWTGTGDLERDVQWAYLDWYRVGFALGWWEARRGRWVEVLSPRGVAAAARAFWAVAARPTGAEPYRV